LESGVNGKRHNPDPSNTVIPPVKIQRFGHDIDAMDIFIPVRQTAFAMFPATAILRAWPSDSGGGHESYRNRRKKRRPALLLSPVISLFYIEVIRAAATNLAKSAPKASAKSDKPPAQIGFSFQKRAKKPSYSKKKKREGRIMETPFTRRSPRYHRQHRKRHTPNTASPRTGQYRKAIAASVSDIADEDGYAFMGELGNLLLKKQPDFDPRNFGFTKLTPLIRSLNRFEVDVRQTADPKTSSICISAIYARITKIRYNW
jgi:Fe-S-cluster formation regulator IscX/YfhJ